MGIKSLFRHYFLSEKVDFISDLQAQATLTHQLINDLYALFILEDYESETNIERDTQKLFEQKKRNMHHLHHAFITPIDRESIYRAITELGWIGLSVKHFSIEAKAYTIKELRAYSNIFNQLISSSKTLHQGFMKLNSSDGNFKSVWKRAEEIREQYDETVEQCVLALAELSNSQKSREVFVYTQIINQLREIARRLFTTANLLEDIVVKMN